MIPTPVEISDLEAAFPAHALGWMPAWDDIPQEFKYGNEWTEFVHVWFYTGLSSYFSFQPATINGELVDAAMAFKQLRAIMGSYEPKHEHKTAAVAYLASLWMESAIYASPKTPLKEHRVLGEATLKEWLKVLKKKGVK